MEFIKFSLYDDETIKLVEKYLGHEVMVGYTLNKNEGITNLNLLLSPSLNKKVKISYTELKDNDVPPHYHDKTRHVYVCLNGAIGLHVLDPKNNVFKDYGLQKHEGCFIPPKVPHGLRADEATLLCVEIPPDNDDFYPIKKKGEVYGI